ncbi:FAD-dependent oxidoreductase [Parahaliea aestuarii]|uniref:NAD(P)-binding protein n=1 Tax=Parahaliea aestuarii TaxID=1852021 RepID=A0A5C8ZX16_9GAMM|nr:FAD-dependent oxidoreductase [Parahaliea aestuarii]TXS91741.1 NAD(P)-binding protein [Parahaliea aestuarii]
MPTGPYARLFEPVAIGSMEIPNRIAMSAMTTNFGTADFEVSERLIEYHATRARGGVGLLTVEMCSVDTAQRYQPQSLSLGDERFIEGHRRLVERVHAEGAKIQPQISHPGPESMTDPVGPSVCVAAGTGWPSRVLAVEEIDAIMDLYAAAAVRAREAGYDGMELHAAHAYMLLGSFLSTQRNRREDDYGGDLEGRARMLLETLRRIKRVAGRDFPVTVRISGFEDSFDGRALWETQLLAPQLVAAGADCIQVSGGVSHDKLVGQIVCGPAYPEAYNAPVAAAIRAVVDVPVMVVGRIHRPEVALQVVEQGSADVVMMARPLLADPELPNKLRQGRERELRRCLSCQNCIDSMLIAPFDANMNCAVNAFSGRETELAVVPAIQRKHVVVIGGGTAGMEAARLSAERGFRVTLLERSPRLGGSLFFAATVHSDNEPLLHFLRNELERLRVDVQLGNTATRDKVAALRPDAVLVATGARVEVPDIPRVAGARIFSGSELRHALSGAGEPAPGSRWPLRLAAAAPSRIQSRLTPALLRRLTRYYLPFGKRVCIVGSDLAAVELAEFIVRRGRQVSLLSERIELATEVGPKRRQEQMVRLDRPGVVLITGIRVERIERAAVHFSRDGKPGSIAADTAVIAGEPVADTTLAEELEGVCDRVIAIGDCTGLGLIRQATEQAARAVCGL